MHGRRGQGLIHRNRMREPRLAAAGASAIDFDTGMVSTRHQDGRASARNPSVGAMRFWSWLISLFGRRGGAMRDPPDAAERFGRDTQAASAARAAESGVTSGTPPAA